MSPFIGNRAERVFDRAVAGWWQRSRLGRATFLFGLSVALLAVRGIVPACARAAEPTAVVFEEEAVVVEDESADEAGIVVEDADEGASKGDSDDDGGAAAGGRSWTAQPVQRRTIEGTPGYTRQSSEAYYDVDHPLALEVKYYFDLSSEPAIRLGSLHQLDEAGLSTHLSLKPAEKHSLGPLADRLPQEVGTDCPVAEAQWLDYAGVRNRKGPDRRLLTILLPSSTDEPDRLLVIRAERGERDWIVDRGMAQRDLPDYQTPKGMLLGAALDCWDRPTALGSRAMFVGRVIALAREVDGRYAVDFFGEKLHTDSDCRLWLTPVTHSWGRLVGIRFVEIPLRRQSGAVTPQSVLALVYENPQGERRQVAVDYPLCSAPIIEQFRQAQTQSSGATSTTDLRKTLGDELVEEFEARLVRAVYR